MKSENNNKMNISVVIPTKNRQELLLPLVRNVLDQDMVPNEIIIVDQTKTSIDLNLVTNIKGNNKYVCSVYYIHNPYLSGVTAARNVGAHLARGNIIIFLEDDIYIYKDFIRQISDTYQKYPEVGGVSCIQVQESRRSALGIILFSFFHRGPFKEEKRYIDKYWYLFKKPVFGVRLLCGVTSYRREIFERYKFDENLIGYGLGNDFDFSYRCSKEFLLAINPKVRAIHYKNSRKERSTKVFYEDKVYFNFYFYKKNVDKNIQNLFFFLLSQFSVILESILGSLQVKSNMPFKTTITSYWKALMG
ncbi:MAG: glycosyltransferase family 2 protein [Candidatus Omnitrophica bacterium]|nr:glycosyltransferase family 2 protein [Candidatus Omnitrophota bacterium]